MKNNFVTIFLFIYAVISKLLVSYYSILYDTSLHYQDGAVFFNVGRMIMDGKILYKESFDHKAPYIHFIYGIASLLKVRHLGLYIVEILLLFIILLYIYKTLKLFDYKYALIVTLLLSLFLNSRNFTQGFFKTETCALAAFAPAIYLFAKYFVSEQKKFNLFNMFIIGALAGFSFMVNIRAIVLFVPFAIVVAYKLIRNKEIINLLLALVMGLLGVFVSVLPYLIYAIYTDSIYDFYHAVIYTNIKYNDAISNSIANRVNYIVKFILHDAFFVFYAVYSFVAVFFIKFNRYLKISIILSYFVGLIYILFTGMDFLYYFIVIVPYFAFGIILFIKIFDKYIGKFIFLEEKNKLKIIFLSMILILFSFATSFKLIYILNMNCIRRSQKLTNIFEDASINIQEKKVLALGFEPMVYTLLDIVPKYKYFYTPDVQYRLCPEPFTSQVNYVMNLDPDIIVLDTPLKSRDIVLTKNFSIQDAYRMRDVIRSNYFLLGAYDMDEGWGTYQIYIKK